MTLTWIKASNGEIPKTAFKTGASESDGKPLFVARVHELGIHPGKLCRGRQGAYIPIDGKEHLKTNYEVLASFAGLYWKSINVGALPDDAVSTGHNVHKTLLYSVKGMIDGNEVIGKYNHKAKKALFPYGGIEHHLGLGEEVEILCSKVCLSTIMQLYRNSFNISEYTLITYPIIRTSS